VSARGRYRYFAMRLSPMEIEDISDGGITGTWTTFATASAALHEDRSAKYGPQSKDLPSVVMRIGNSPDSYRRVHPNEIEVQVGSAWVPFREWATRATSHKNPPWRPIGAEAGGRYQTFYADGRKSWAFEDGVLARDWSTEIGGKVEDHGPGGYARHVERGTLRTRKNPAEKFVAVARRHDGREMGVWTSPSVEGAMRLADDHDKTHSITIRGESTSDGTHWGPGAGRVVAVREGKRWQRY
jgi:hypothetical protein